MRRPWNITNEVIYSLVSYSDTLKYNMNICTYVSVVNMKPKIYVITIDYKTLTYQNLTSKSHNVVLQILSKENISLIRQLGKNQEINSKKINT